jgi:hypothetical protein
MRVSSLQPPLLGGGVQVAVDRITISSGLLNAHIVGESAPRVIQEVEAYVGLSRGYQNLELDIKGRARERAAENRKARTRRLATSNKCLD